MKMEDTIISLKTDKLAKEKGFAVTGQHSSARMLGTYEATTLDDAVKQYMVYYFDSVAWDSHGRGRHTIWGCEIFDNENKARKSFG